MLQKPHDTLCPTYRTNAKVFLETVLEAEPKTRKLADNTEIYSWTLSPPTISIMIVGQRYKVDETDEKYTETEMCILSRCDILEFHTREEINDKD